MTGHSLDDLRRVIRRIETRRPKRPAPQPIEEVLGGELVDTGEGKLLDNGKRAPFQVKEGDRVLFTSYSGNEVNIDGEEYLIMTEEDILAVVE